MKVFQQNKGLIFVAICAMLAWTSGVWLFWDVHTGYANPPPVIISDSVLQYAVHETHAEVIGLSPTAPVSDVHVDIPAMFNGVPVTHIAGWAFGSPSPSTRITKLTIGSNVTFIGAYAFELCNGLTGDLVIPDNVITIQGAAFRYTAFTGNLTIGNSVTAIGQQAFAGTQFTGTVTLGNSLTTIPEDIFSCIPFTGQLIIPSSVTHIGVSAFELACFTGSLVIPDSVTSIGGYAFFNAGFTDSLLLGSGVTNIGSNAFRDTSFTTVHLERWTAPDGITILAPDAFANTSITKVIVPPGSITAYTADPTWSGLTSIMEEFDPIVNDSVLQYYIHPSHVEVLGLSPTAPVSDVHVDIPATFQGKPVTHIANWAFGSPSPSTRITDLTIGSNVTTIGVAAFHNCAGFTDPLVIPNGVITIGSQAFHRTSFTGNLAIPNSVTTIGVDAFASAGFDGTLSLGNKVGIIGANAFSANDFTGPLVLPASVTSLGSAAFYNAGFTGSLTIGSGITTIADWMFAETGFTGGLTIPVNVTAIGSYAFTGTDFIGNLDISDKVTSIGSRAFMGNTRLTSLSVERWITPDGITALVNSDAFAIESGKPDTFLTRIVVPVDSLSTYKAASQWVNLAHLMLEYPGLCPECDEYPCVCPCPHDMPSGWTVITPATCTTSGLESRTCTLAGCDYTETRPISASGHDYDWVETTPATCTTDAIESYKCKVCNHVSNTRTGTSALLHDMPGTWETVTEETCTADGLEKRVCKRDDCDHTETKPIPADPCGVCEKCDPQCLDHDWTSWQTIAPATCTTQGLESRYCVLCDHPETNILSALGHNHEWTETTPAACTTAAIESYKCTRCNNVENTRAGNSATGHNWTPWQPTPPPTCTTLGLEARHCLTCLEPDTNILPAAGHDMPAEWLVVTQPSCTTQGLQVKQCANCSHYVTETIPPEPCGVCFICDPPCDCGICEECRSLKLSTVDIASNDETVFLVNIDEGTQELIYNGELTFEWWRRVGENEWELLSDIPADQTWAPLVLDSKNIVYYRCDIHLDGAKRDEHTLIFHPPDPLPNFWRDFGLWILAGFFAITGLFFVTVSFNIPLDPKPRVKKKPA